MAGVATPPALGLAHETHHMSVTFTSGLRVWEPDRAPSVPTASKATGLHTAGE